MVRMLSAEHVRGRKLLLGVVHLAALPGSPRYRGRDDVLERAQRDARALIAGGLDGFIVENYGDAPFYRDRVPASTIAEMAVLVRTLGELVGDGPWIGVNVLRNDARAALSIAAAAQAELIRVNVHVGEMATDQGAIRGRADRTLRLRAQLDASVAILADVGVKHAVPPPGFDLVEAARDTVERGLADGLIVTGRRTGSAIDLGELRAVRAAVPDSPLFAGSGVSAGNIRGVLAHADGVIVGTALKEDAVIERPVDEDRVRALVAASGEREQP